ncbi:Ger(x)C family spore germination protein [Neobacillus sp. PS3-34]|uniref:Ger(x)C family spore germination protein n=1 Tax=Neobacillus sp. PS3-34 TaxID=3070678 RepID=UPI0027DEE1BF|nr:Ger(x)C family spore germination protein [Neobacillus sp. PS3-34]WML47038.1 Ger(x)C family spore germination protein [Neobacillus sp. PS3-34]
MRKVVLYLFIISTILTGCVQKEILDDVNLETGAAYDYIGGKRIRGTALVPVYMPDKAVKNKTFSATSLLSRDFLRDIQRQTPDPIVTGSLEVVLFGEKLAKKGLQGLIDSLQRDASIGSSLYFAVTKGEAKDLIEGDYGNRGNGIYISNLIRHNMKTKDLPKTNLQLFLFDFYQTGKTGYLPELTKIGKNQIEISGLSFFQRDKVVDTLPAGRMFYFKLLVDKYSEGTLKVNIGKEIAAIQSIHSKNSMKLVRRNPNEVLVKIKIKAVLNEFSGKNTTSSELANIEKTMQKEIEKECLKLSKRFQNERIDPVGYGHFVKSHTRHFDYKKWWNEDYQKLKIKVQAKVKITESGVIE